MPTPKLTNQIIEAAIDGFLAKQKYLDSRIAELRAMLPGGSLEPAIAETTEAALAA